MMNQYFKSRLFALVFCLSVPLANAIGADKAATAYIHEGKQYPPVFFVTNIENDTYEEKLKSYQAFTDINAKASGLPIAVRVVKGHRNKQNATSFSTAMLSASTLGIIPIVANTEFKVHYDVFVQGKSIAKFKYQMDATEVNNIWTSSQYDRETKPSEQLFIEHTIPLFLTELKNSIEVQAVFNEYWEYFE